MKKTSLLMFIILLCFGCTKDPGMQKLKFTPHKANSTVPINYDSIAYTTITYSDNADTHTVDINVRTEYLNLKNGHTYSFNKFDMVDITGKVKYYIPSKSDTAAKYILMRLPIFFKIQGDAGLFVSIAPYPY